MNKISLRRSVFLCDILCLIAACSTVHPVQAAIQLSESPSAGSGVLNFQIAPDSSRVLYRIQRNTSSGVTQELFSAPVDTAGMQIQLSNSLVPDDEGVVSGGVLFTPEGSMAVYGGDLDTDGQFEVYSSQTASAGTQLKLNNAPAHMNIATNQVKLIPDGARVLYRADFDTDNDFDLYSAGVNSAGTQIRLTDAPVTNGDVSVNDFYPTPNGMRVIFLGDMDADGVDELYSASTTAAGTQVKLNSVSPFGGDVMDDFQMTPDSNRVIYRGQLETVLVNELYSTPTDGTGPQIKLSGAPTPGFSGVDGAFRLTPDGSRVLYAGRLDTDARELFSAPTDETGMQIKLNTTPVENGALSGFQLTPNGLHTIYSGDFLMDGRTDLFSAPIDVAGQQMQLNSNVAGGNVGQFQLTSDSSRVVYTGDMNTLGQPELYSAPTGVSGMQITLSTNTLGSGGVGSFFLGPDGSRVGYTGLLTTSGVFDLYMASTTEEDTQVALTNLAANQGVTAAEFTPDGQFIVYSVDTDGDFSADTLLAADVVGGGSPLTLSDPLIIGGRITQFLVSPDSQTVIYRANQDDLGVFNLFAASLTDTTFPGDFDGDGDVDGRDFLVWQRGGSPSPLSAGDLADWQASYGTGQLVASVAVPEPSAWLLLVGGALLKRKDYKRCGVLSFG